jgi:hypothetical protein
MPYILDKQDLANIMHEVIVGDAVDDDDQYMELIQDIMFVVTKHFGGVVGHVEANPDQQDAALVYIDRDDTIPEGATIYDKYDSDSDEEDTPE